MIKNIFLDRDGIINEVVVRNYKIESPRTIHEFKIRQEFIDFYHILSKYNFNLFVVSNQPDISRKLMDPEELRLMTLKLKSNFYFKDIKYCTHDDKDDCNCRKPKPGLILDTINKHGLSLSESILIGDSWKDIGAGKGAGIKTIFLLNPYNKPKKQQPDFYINKLEEILNLKIWE